MFILSLGNSSISEQTVSCTLVVSFGIIVYVHTIRIYIDVNLTKEIATRFKVQSILVIATLNLLQLLSRRNNNAHTAFCYTVTPRFYLISFSTLKRKN